MGYKDSFKSPYREFGVKRNLLVNVKSKREPVGFDGRIQANKKRAKRENKYNNSR